MQIDLNAPQKRAVRNNNYDIGGSSRRVSTNSIIVVSDDPDEDEALNSYL